MKNRYFRLAGPTTLKSSSLSWASFIAAGTVDPVRRHCPCIHFNTVKRTSRYTKCSLCTLCSFSLSVWSYKWIHLVNGIPGTIHKVFWDIWPVSQADRSTHPIESLSLQGYSIVENIKSGNVLYSKLAYIGPVSQQVWLVNNLGWSQVWIMMSNYTVF